MQPGVFPPGMRPPRLPFPGPGQLPPGDPKQKQAMIEEFQEKIKEVSKRLGYAPGHVHEQSASAAQQGHDPSGEVPSEVKDKKPEIRPGGHKPSISSEEEKTDDTDLADFFSMFILYYYVMFAY